MGCGGDAEDGQRAGAAASNPSSPVAGEAVQVSQADFAGAESCRACHADQYGAWAASTHGRAGGPPDEELVIAPFDGRPIMFSDGTVTPRVDADGTWVFEVSQEGFETEIWTVDGVVGGGHMLGGGTQGFVSRLADGTVRFLPYDYSRQEQAWFCNTGTRLGQGWAVIQPDMAMADCGDFPPVRALGTLARFANCQSCHGSQIDASLVPGEGVRTTWQTLAVDCESCHGPAADHVSWAEGGGGGEDIGLASRVVDGVEESLETCFQCHALKDVVEEGYLSGESFVDHYALKLPVLGDDPYLPDGRVRTFAYQGTHLSSACYVDGSMTCVSCHEPHGQGYWDVNRSPLASEVDDGQCTSCHASKAVDPAAHTGHPTSAGVTCVSCHMPYLQHPEVGNEIPFARSDHTIPVPRPEVDGRLGLVSACRSCHEDRSEPVLQAEAESIWGILKPHNPLAEALLEVAPAMGPDEAAELLLRPELDRPMAQFQALARFVTGWVGTGRDPGPEATRRVEALAASGDVDIRALALATLHLIRPPGEAPLVADESLAVRRRWAMVLSYVADQALAQGDAAAAEAVYGKALTVLPEDGAVLRSLGLVHNHTGDFQSAVEVFNRSLASEPNAPLTWVNLGVALAGAGDPGGAIRSYQSALRIDPNEPLAYLNLGNVHLRGGSLDPAIDAYQRAVALDPGLGLAHFNLGIALIRAQRIAEALPHARRAVEFSPENPQARQMLADLERALEGSP